MESASVHVQDMGTQSRMENNSYGKTEEEKAEILGKHTIKSGEDLIQHQIAKYFAGTVINKHYNLFFMKNKFILFYWAIYTWNFIHISLSFSIQSDLFLAAIAFNLRIFGIRFLESSIIFLLLVPKN